MLGCCGHDMDSGHSPPLDFEVVDEQASTLDDDIAEEFWLNLANKAFQNYRSFMLEYLCHYNDPAFLSIEEQGL